jgi:hypothetical protein
MDVRTHRIVREIDIPPFQKISRSYNVEIIVLTLAKSEPCGNKYRKSVLEGWIFWVERRRQYPLIRPKLDVPALAETTFTLCLPK